MIPPTPPVDATHGNSTVSTEYEYYSGSTGYPDCTTGSLTCNEPGVYGLGIRVPCFVVSPWSKGGYVNSQVFDHTSLIRFIQAVFGPRYGGLAEPNITPWRQAVCGDMTTAFDFSTPNAARVGLPSTATFVPPNGIRQIGGYQPPPPATQSLPTQEKRLHPRPARALPYEMTADAVTSAQTVDITFMTTGQQAVVFQVRTTLDTQRSYTVEPGKSLADSWAHNNQPYDLSVSGPNGFLRRFKGDVPLGATGLRVQESYLPASQTITLSLSNGNSAAVALLVTDGYSGAQSQLVLQPGQNIVQSFQLQATYGWYDLSITTPSIPSFGVQFAGHLENGKDSFSDPMISAASA